jgi:hypothetical protein
MSTRERGAGYDAEAILAERQQIEALVAKAGEVMRERCANLFWTLAFQDIQVAIRALPGVTMEDLR